MRKLLQSKLIRSALRAIRWKIDVGLASVSQVTTNTFDKIESILDAHSGVLPFWQLGDRFTHVRLNLSKGKRLIPICVDVPSDVIGTIWKVDPGIVSIMSIVPHGQEDRLWTGSRGFDAAYFDGHGEIIVFDFGRATPEHPIEMTVDVHDDVVVDVIFQSRPDRVAASVQPSEREQAVTVQ